MRRKFEALYWSEFHWQRPFGIDDVKSMLGQLVGLSRRKAVVFEIRLSKNRVRYLLGTEEQDKRHISQLIQSHRAIQFSRATKRETLLVARLVNIKESHYALKTDSVRKYDTFQALQFQKYFSQMRQWLFSWSLEQVHRLAHNQKICRIYPLNGIK